MSNTKHTPGPWRILEQRGSFPVFEIGSSELPEFSHIAKLYTATMDNGLEQEANAKLIAAAPELLEALQKAIADPEKLANCAMAYRIAKDFNVTDKVKQQAEWYGTLKAAIKKATE